MAQHSFVIPVFLSLILLSTPITMTGAFAQQSENKIPSWVKNNAEWWADGAIDESSFIQGIQYLIKEDIIDIPATAQGTSSNSDGVPSWVKNNAEWWADGAIDESSFIQGIQFLIEEGVMQIPSTEDIPPQDISQSEQSLVPQETVSEKTKPIKEDPKPKKISKYNPNDEKNLTKSEKVKSKHDRMALQAATDGEVRVIVELDVDFKSNLTKQEKDDKKQIIKDKQKLLKDVLSSNGIKSLHNLKHSPFVVMTVNPTVLDELISSGLVKTVHEDIGLSAFLDDTVPQIGADVVHTAGVTGSGTLVAILDSGVERTHGFFAGTDRIAFEACFTGNGAAAGVFGCPNGETGDDAAVPCPPPNPSPGINEGNASCYHGTHVAGIAAGSQATGTPESGVAKGADIVAINVFTLLPIGYTVGGEACPEAPGCMLAYLADIALGLDHVNELADDGANIIAVNLSLGSIHAFEDPNDCDIGVVAGVLKVPIDALRDDGIVTIASSGNTGDPDALSSPACITTVVSVSSVDENDYIPTYGNQANYLDLLAPGGNGACSPAGVGTCQDDNGSDTGVRSSVPGNTFKNAYGTSMAAPHVTGAWALLKSSNDIGNPSIDEVLHILKNTGLLLFDPTTGLSTPRIQLDKALDALIHAPECPISIVNIDNFIFGTTGNDKIYGTTDNDLIVGLAGNDDINGYSGDDCLIGGPGEDNLSGGDDNDYLYGGDDADHLKGGNGGDTIFGDGGNDIIDGGAGDDTLNGGPDNDHLVGRAGMDTLNGDGGNDILDGGDVDVDTFVDSDGLVDNLDGGSGDDYLYGRDGIDILDGGSDTDWCVPGDGETVSNCEINS